MEVNQKSSKENQCKTEGGARSLAKPQFISSNFDFLYDSFHQPLTNLICCEGEMIGLTKDGELKHFEHTKISKEVENDLTKYAKEKNSEMLEVKIVSYYKIYKDELDEPLKYILSFYKVTLWNNIRVYLNIWKEVMIKQKKIISIASIYMMEIRNYTTI